MSSSLTILGAGNTAFATAARLTHRGHRVTLFELPEFADALTPIEGDRTITLHGVAETGPAVVHALTRDPAEAAAASDLLLLIIPAYGHRAFAEALAPHLTPDHTVVLMPGTLGSLEWAKVLADRGVGGVTLAEVDTAPYVCRKTAPREATIWGVVTGLGLGVLPADRTEPVRQRLEPLFPGVRTYPDVLACGLSAMNPVVHPAGVLMNAGRVERSHGDFYFYEEGVTPSVANVILRVDDERRAIGKALGYDLTRVDDAFHEAGFGPKGDLWATINGSRMLTQLRAPGTLESRWLTEDIPYGIAVWSALGERLGVLTPTMRGLVDIGSVVMGLDGWSEGRSLADLGIDALVSDGDALKRYLQTGQSRT